MIVPILINQGNTMVLSTHGAVIQIIAVLDLIISHLEQDQNLYHSSHLPSAF